MKRLSRNVRFVVINADGFAGLQVSRPRDASLEDLAVDGRVVVVPEDGVMPAADMKIDRRKLRRAVNYVASLRDVVSTWRPTLPTAADLFGVAQGDAIDLADAHFAARMDALRGPLAAVHIEKRRQAEAGGGPLVGDEADRLAILANAAAQDEAVAAIERQRRDVKALLRAATTEDEIKAILADI